MDSDMLVQKVAQHLENGGRVRLKIGRDGRRFVQLSTWMVFWSSHQISGATEAALQRLLVSRSSQPGRSGSSASDS